MINGKKVPSMNPSIRLPSVNGLFRVNIPWLCDPPGPNGLDGSMYCHTASAPQIKINVEIILMDGHISVPSLSRKYMK